MKLSSLTKEEKDRVNLYAIILDCSAPYYMEKTHKYQCTMKLFDTSLNPEKSEPITATIFGKKISDIPRVTSVGTIIRLHRAQSKKFKKAQQLNCDVSIKGAWILFDPTYGTTPTNESGKGHTFTTEDKSLLADIRKYAKNYFVKNELTAITLKEAEKKKKDFDTLCYVVDVKKKGTVNKVSLRDGHKNVKLDIPTKSNLSIAPLKLLRTKAKITCPGGKASNNTCKWLLYCRGL